MRIAFTGPESSGKTTFSNWLSEHLLNCRLVNEYAREYLEEQQLTRATEDDFQKIVKQQNLLFKEVHSYSHEIFDTDLFVLRIWNDEVFKLKLPELELNDVNSMDIHFLCAPHVKWEADPLRSAPDGVERGRIFEKYKTELTHHQARFVILNGSIERKKELILETILANHAAEGVTV
jgi:nicotinamide riboside kinase